MKSYISLCLLSQKEYRRSENLSCHHLQTPDIETTKTNSSKEIFWGQSSSPTEPWLLRRQLDASIIARIPPRQLHQHRSLQWSPKNPPGVRQQHPIRQILAKHQKEKTIFLYFGVLRKRIRIRGEKQFVSTPDQKASFYPSLYALHGGRVRFFSPYPL